MWRIKHSHKYSSVIILIIDQDRILAFKRECELPVSAYVYRPVTGKLTFQLMETPTWSIHILSPFCIVESKKLTSKFFSVFRLNARFGTGLKEPLNTSMPKGFYHQHYCIA